MKTPRSTRVRGWRWRRNPLRRRSDLVEAWILLVAWTIALVAGLVAGLLTADAVGRMPVPQRSAHPAVPALPGAAQHPNPRDPASRANRPSAEQSVATEAVVATMAAAATGGVVWAGTRAVRHRIDEQRMEQWSAEWERFDARRGRRAG